MFYMYIFLFIVVCSDSVLSKSLIAPCKVEDEACIMKSVNAALPEILSGIPSLGVESSDPLFIDHINGDLSIIKYKFFNSTITGFKKCTVSNLKVKTDISTLHFDLNCPPLDMRGLYEIKGRLVVLPVEGEGEYELITGDYKIIVDSELKRSTGSDGKTYVTIKNFKLQMKALSAVHYDFKNLFYGQKDLSDATHKFAHENWQEVQELVQEPSWYAFMKKVISNVNKYLKTVPLDEMRIE